MPRRPSPRRRLEEVLAKYEISIRAAFTESVREIRDTARVAAIAAALEAGDVARAVELVGADAVAFRRLQSAVRDAFEGAGQVAIQTVPPIAGADGVRLLVRFDPGNQRAAQWSLENGARLVTRIAEDQRQAVHMVMVEGLERGRSPLSIARDIVGSINRATGRREGGIVGLTARQAEYVIGARDELLSGDPARMAAYLERKARDRRFDRSIQAAIREGRAVPAETAKRAVQQYENRLLAYRGEVIGRTEATNAVNAASREAFEQTIEAAGIDRQLVTKAWRSVKDARTRDSHRDMDGEEVQMDQPYSNGLMHPGDVSGPPEEVINCRCVQTIRIGRPRSP